MCCLTNLLLTEKWLTRIIDEGDVADIMCFDFSKTFDSVNQRFLRRKQMAYNINAGLIRWIEASLRDGSFREGVNGCVSDCISAQSGSVLCPILFPIYANELPDLLQLDCSLKPSAHCTAAVKQASAALFPVKLSIVNITSPVFLLLHCYLVRLRAEYAIQAASPY